MALRKTKNTFLEDDEMGSYGLHPLVHERLIRCHNPALFDVSTGREAPIAKVQARVQGLMRDPVKPPSAQERDRILSA